MIVAQDFGDLLVTIITFTVYMCLCEHIKRFRKSFDFAKMFATNEWLTAQKGTAFF